MADYTSVTAFNLSNATAASITVGYRPLHERVFTTCHVVTNILLAVVGLSASLTLLSRSSSSYYAERRLRAIGVTQTQILLACVIFCSIYLPCMVVHFLGIDLVYQGPLCVVLMWVYGTVHATIMVMSCFLSVCWLVRILWPNINIKTHLHSLYVALFIGWLAPTLMIGTHIVLQADQYSLPSEIFCMCDLEFPMYLPCIVMPLAIITLICYVICFVAIRQWKNLQYEVSPRIVDIVSLTVQEVDALNAHSTSFFMFATLYLCWKTMFMLCPVADYYSPIILHTSIILVPALAALANKSFYSWVCAPIANYCKNICLTKAATVNPPSYEDTMATIAPAADTVTISAPAAAASTASIEVSSTQLEVNPETVAPLTEASHECEVNNVVETTDSAEGPVAIGLSGDCETMNEACPIDSVKETAGGYLNHTYIGDGRVNLQCDPAEMNTPNYEMTKVGSTLTGRNNGACTSVVVDTC